MNYLLLLLLLPLQLVAQKVDEVETYFEQYAGVYKSDLRCKWFFSRKERKTIDFEETSRNYCGGFLMILRSDGTYTTDLTTDLSNDGKIYSISYHFEGIYQVDEAGNVILTGTHPFKKNQFQIHQKRNPELESSGFAFRLNKQHNWITKKRIFTFGDGF